MSELFAGQTLKRNKAGDSVDADVSELKGKVVALYFSAHWCPPCRQFTPVLKQFYNGVPREEFEVVFVTFDRTDEDFKAYLKEAHGDWLFLPLNDPFIKVLSEKYGVSGIPSLIVIKADGSVIAKTARNDVSGTSNPANTVSGWKAQL